MGKYQFHLETKNFPLGPLASNEDKYSTVGKDNFGKFIFWKHFCFTWPRSIEFTLILNFFISFDKVFVRVFNAAFEALYENNFQRNSLNRLRIYLLFYQNYFFIVLITSFVINEGAKINFEIF